MQFARLEAIWKYGASILALLSCRRHLDLQDFFLMQIPSGQWKYERNVDWRYYCPSTFLVLPQISKNLLSFSSHIFQFVFYSFWLFPRILWWIKKRIIASGLANTIYKAVICYCLLELHFALNPCSEFKILIPEIHLSFVLITAGSQTGQVRDTNVKDCVREWISKIGSFLGGHLPQQPPEPIEI